MTIEYTELTNKRGVPYARWFIVDRPGGRRVSPLFKTEDDAREWLRAVRRA